MRDHIGAAVFKWEIISEERNIYVLSNVMIVAEAAAKVNCLYAAGEVKEVC